MTIAGQRRDRLEAAAVFFVPAPVERLIVFEADGAAAVLARMEVFRADEARRLPLVVVFVAAIFVVALLVVLAVALAAFATDFFATGRSDHLPVACLAGVVVRFSASTARVAVAAERFAALGVRLAVFVACSVDVTARFAVPAR